MKRSLKRYSLWIFYAAFLLLAVIFGGRESLFTSADERLTMAKTVVLIVFIGFLIYSLYATKKENFFRTLGVMNRLYWGRQVGMDLYISVFLSLAIIYLVEGSFVVTALWLVPVLIFANLAILPYLLLNFTAVVGVFLS
ncbi:MAG: hypothetical protein AAF393_08710 [Pseudomonadota bacterium]